MRSWVFAPMTFEAAKNIGLNYCAHAHPVRQVVARLKVVRAVQGHRGGERSARIARSAPVTASHAHAEAMRIPI